MSQTAGTHDPEADATTLTPPALPSTRLYPPRLHANLVQRSSLLTKLSDDPERRVTVITAPAGYGKSTLAAQLVARLALPMACGATARRRDPRRSMSMPRRMRRSSSPRSQA